MRTIFVAAVAALALSTGVAFAQAGGGAGGGGNPAVGNSTSTSMGAPKGSPGLSAPRSESMPGVSGQQRMAEQNNAAGGTQTDQGVTTPVQGPRGSMDGGRQIPNLSQGSLSE